MNGIEKITAKIQQDAEAEVQALMAQADEKVAAIDEDYEMGLMSPEERHRQVVDIWNEANDEVGDAMADNFDRSEVGIASKLSEKFWPKAASSAA